MGSRTARRAGFLDCFSSCTMSNFSSLSSEERSNELDCRLVVMIEDQRLEARMRRGGSTYPIPQQTGRRYLYGCFQSRPTHRGRPRARCVIFTAEWCFGRIISDVIFVDRQRWRRKPFPQAGRRASASWPMVIWYRSLSSTKPSLGDCRRANEIVKNRLPCHGPSVIVGI